MKANWLDNALVKSPVNYALATTEAIMVKLLKGLRVPRKSWPDFISPGVAGKMVELVGDKGGSISLVLVSPKSGDGPEIVCTLVHEAVHVLQQIRAQLGEKEFSSECEAYALESIVRNLFNEYARQTHKAIKKEKKKCSTATK